MTLFAYVEQLYIHIVDFIFAHLPQPQPSNEALKKCKIISHRGEHRGLRIKENTLPAFEAALAGGVWGIELDVRWTRDFVPVVVHDSDLKRVFGKNEQIADLTLRQLQQCEPAIPTLAQVVRRFCGKLHLMVEIKDNSWPDAQRQSHTLLEALGPLTPVVDYHLMALTPHVLSRINGFAAASLLAIANHRPFHYSDVINKKHWGGLCAHYSLMTRGLIEKAHAHHQTVGTAYPASRNVLFREINRGVDWIFSNNACELMAFLNRKAPHKCL
jgi:glycerophosphoryl diester phosphodiesterase